jgi:CIC family chloride channel protein
MLTRATKLRLTYLRRFFASNQAPFLLIRNSPLDLRIVGRMLVHAALVGLAAGVAGSAFFAVAEIVQTGLLESLGGYHPLRAAGETFADRFADVEGPFRPWLLLLLPAAGAGIAGLLCRLAPETAGGGGDAMIHAFHHGGGHVRLRVIWVRACTAILTLGSGGSGGREGPTMQIGGAIGSAVASMLRMSSRERRILYIAGVGAGMAAVFRTPLGAALLAVEVLYRDDFESEALIPSVLASVVAYSVSSSVLGQSKLFGHLEPFHFKVTHLPLYALMALIVAMAAAAFAATLHAVQGLFERLNAPAWVKPALGGLGLGLLAIPMIASLGVGMPGGAGRGLGLLGGSYGAAQVALTGASWLPLSWHSVGILLVLGMLKLGASALTIGSGGSAGDFAPSLILGGLLGCAFGQAAALLLADPSLEPGAFALVGMATFYGGIAHVPLSAIVMVCELAGSYDLLVPLMLAAGIAFVALRHHTLYRSQLPSTRESPAHRDAALAAGLEAMAVDDIALNPRPLVTFELGTTGPQMLQAAGGADTQSVFPVQGKDGRVAGVVTAEILHTLALERDALPTSIAADLLQPAALARAGDSLMTVLIELLAKGMRGAVLVDEAGHLRGLIDETEIVQAQVVAASRSR